MRNFILKITSNQHILSNILNANIPVIILLLCSSFFISCNNGESSYEPLPKHVDFNYHIRPILVQNCYLCHGPDPSSREADLRLDTFEGATAALREGGHAIVPGKPGQSEMIARINHEHEDKVMPPPKMNSALSQRDKDLLEKWIRQGAEWKQHWSFIKPYANEEYQDVASIDFFIDKRLKEKKLKKVSLADKNTLIRRVSYLLTGLPPNSTEIENYLADTSDNAYENMVNHYLNSAGYGERWARHWMDLVRYAETKGHEFDYTITGAWKYRDYLIRAFNNDIPYDQLLTEHLAGDMLEEKRYNPENGLQESHLATAFYTLGEGTHSPVDIREDEAIRIDNMIDVTTKTFQGLTVSCAKCHDHKFDPITAEDYYALYGIMESTRFTPIDTKESKSKTVSSQKLLELHEYMNDLVAEKVESDKNQFNTKNLYSSNYSMIGDFRNADFDNWISGGRAFGNRTTLGNPIIDASTGRIKKLDQGRASSKSFDTGIFGTLRSPNFVVDSDFIGVRARGKNSSIRIIIDNFQLIQYPIYGDLIKEVKNSEWTNYTFNVGAWKGHKAYVEIITGVYEKHNFKLPEDAFVEAEYALGYNEKWPSEVEISPSESSKPFTASQINTLNKKLQNGQLSSYFKDVSVVMDSLNRLAKDIKNSEFIYGVTEGFAINSPVFIRGSHKEPSKHEVPRRFLSALPLGDQVFKSEGSGRLELANAMLNEDNPLTSRVMVNRIWHYLFGRGIVETVDNFGLQGKLPSHPELLDHLALKFQNEGWSIKKMIKYIVTSEAFKRSTIKEEELSSKDPTNIYLSSFPVRRLESEAIRDGILAASNSLDKTVYGPPVPLHLTSFMQGRGRPAKSGPLDGNGRRSIYLEVRRNFLEPMMTTFDRPIPFTTFGKRDITNVPSQSLILMNDPFVIAQSEIMAKNLLKQGDLSTEQKINWIYMQAFSRKPSTEEISNANEFIRLLEKMKKTDASETDLDVEVWKEYCHSIFNLKEFIYLI